MIVIFSGTAAISEQIAKSHRLTRSEYKHLRDSSQIQGMRGHDLWVTPTAVRHRDYKMIMDLARATEMNIKRMDFKS